MQNSSRRLCDFTTVDVVGNWEISFSFQMECVISEDVYYMDDSIKERIKSPKIVKAGISRRKMPWIYRPRCTTHIIWILLRGSLFPKMNCPETSRCLKLSFWMHFKYFMCVLFCFYFFCQRMSPPISPCHKRPCFSKQNIKHYHETIQAPLHPGQTFIAAKTIC